MVYGGIDGRPLFYGPVVGGNFDRRGPRDVVIGTARGGEFRGSVTMLRGTATGLTGDGSVTIRRTSDGMPLRNDGFRNFGATLAAGDVDGDGDDDVLVGSFSETARGLESAGGVFLIRGALGGITTEGVQAFSQASPGVPGNAHFSGVFGFCVELIDLDGDGRTEAAIASWDSSTTKCLLPTRALSRSFQRRHRGLSGQGTTRLDPADFGVTAREAIQGSDAVCGGRSGAN